MLVKMLAKRLRSGFLHCAAHDEAVSSFGRNDEFWVGAKTVSDSGEIGDFWLVGRLCVALVKMTIFGLGIEREQTMTGRIGQTRFFWWSGLSVA